MCLGFPRTQNYNVSHLIIKAFGRLYKCFLKVWSYMYNVISLDRAGCVYFNKTRPV